MNKRWSKDPYVIFFRICIALTDSHIRLYPLRADDSVIYDHLLGRLAAIVIVLQ